MPIFGFSYKTDSTSEVFLKVSCDCIETAVTQLSQIKRLPESEVLNLFNITQLEYGNEHNIFTDNN